MIKRFKSVKIPKNEWYLFAKAKYGFAHFEIPKGWKLEGCEHLPKEKGVVTVRIVKVI